MRTKHLEKLGYAKAAGPMGSTTIHTGQVGLETLRTDMITRDGIAVPLYAAWPHGDARRPLVLVISEAFGLHEHIADIVRRFAHLGFFAVAPDLMFRQGNPRTFGTVAELVEKLLLKIPDVQVMQDLDATVGWAKSQGADTSRIATTGFCWGGRWVWLYASHRKLSAAVAWYGILDGDESKIFAQHRDLFPSHPVDVAGKIKTPVLGLYGAKDDAIPTKTVERMSTLLREGNVPARSSQVLVYPDAGHAFFADYRESYHHESAVDAWQQCINWISNRTFEDCSAIKEDL